ncbi:hypothetical protein CHS0354_042445 [Potamilus streckersoni]|uniref:Dehydrogenase/reductase SDR family member 1 n=1 Tax=Potamilus streckersoni TaxID=2493646 RepID=A0AAE0S968_9BIVA|nr:hypothetical protein CHS0354_042445 [Potamilus streckersoni]
MAAKSLAGKVCLVTGATRGIGRGIALQLGENGAIVYITGRTLEAPKEPGGSLKETAREIELRGGRCIPVQCNHANDDEIKQLFELINREQSGQLDILVNNAYSAVYAVFNNIGKQFWEQPLSMWDDVNNVGLRNHYLCTVYAAKMMVPRKSGLIVNVSSAGGLRYMFNVCYGIGKEACDRMAADCGLELRKHNVAFVSLWPGAVRTENTTHIFAIADLSNLKISGPITDIERAKQLFENGESTEFSGKCIVGLATDPNVMKKSGKILLTCDLGEEYGFLDKDDRKPFHMRQLNYIIPLLYPKLQFVASWLPNFLRVPTWIMAKAGNKMY